MITHSGMVIWLTGLPGSGKTTLANCLEKRLKRQGAKTQILDGDELRKLKFVQLGFTENDRTLNIEVTGNMANVLKSQGIITIVAVIAPYREVRDWVMNKIGAIEVFVDAPVEVCIKRDPKGMYAKALRGEIKRFTGVDDPYDHPPAPDVHVRTDRETVDESCDRIYGHLIEKGHINNVTDYHELVHRANPVERIWRVYPFSTLLLIRDRKTVRLKWKAAVEDTLQRLGIRRYNHKHRVLFVAGLPKAGTTWMKKILELAPGYQSREVYDPSRAPYYRNVSDLTFDLLPKYSHSVVKLHTKYTAENLEVLFRRLDKFVVLHRDLRDMCVSRYYHILSRDSIGHQGLYKSLGKKAAITHCINMVNNHFVSWVKNWHEIAKEFPDRILEVRYEDMVNDTRETAARVYSFYDIEPGADLLEAVENTRLKKEKNLSESLKAGSTARRGRIGDWKLDFDEEHKDHFKKIAGDLLINLGYEKDLDW